MYSSILDADHAPEWHRAVAPGVEVGEITTHGLALSRLKHGVESRWGIEPLCCCLDSCAQLARTAPEPGIQARPRCCSSPASDPGGHSPSRCCHSGWPRSR